jgi:hypothetical protein
MGYFITPFALLETPSLTVGLPPRLRRALMSGPNLGMISAPMRHYAALHFRPLDSRANLFAD